MCLFVDEADSISQLVDKSVRSEDPSKIWTQIEDITEKKNKAVEEAETKLQAVK